MNVQIHIYIYIKQYYHPPHFIGKEIDLPEGHTEFWIWVFCKNLVFSSLFSLVSVK